MNIGNRIKYLRKKRNLTLQQLTEITGLSTGYLSNLERNLTSPTLINLQQICEALSINITDLLNSLPQDKIVVRKNERREIFNIESRVKYESTTEGKKNMKGVCMTIKGGEYFEEISWGHHSDEFGIVAEGTIKIDINGEEYVLNKGDSIYIYAHTPHKFSCLSQEDCISYWTFIENVNNNFIHDDNYEDFYDNEDNII